MSLLRSTRFNFKSATVNNLRADKKKKKCFIFKRTVVENNGFFVFNFLF